MNEEVPYYMPDFFFILHLFSFIDMSIQSNRNKQIAQYVLSGSTTMVGVCFTVIALFRVMRVSLETYADEMLAINSCIFISSSIFAYASLRKENNKILEWVADILFFLGMLVMLFVGFIIVYSTY